jgi:WD40 repeat protein
LRRDGRRRRDHKGRVEGGVGKEERHDAAAALLVSGSDDYTVRLWGVDDGECKRVLEGHSESVSSVNIGYAPY